MISQPSREVLDVELRRVGSKGRPSEAGRQPVVEEKEAGLQADKYFSPTSHQYFSADASKYFSATLGNISLQTQTNISLQVEKHLPTAWETSLMAGEVPDTEARYRRCKNVLGRHFLKS